MNFRKYNSIENSYRKPYLEILREEGFFKHTYVVQEKVHGSNLSFITDGKSIQTAKRTDLLDEQEKFYNFQEVRDKYADRILKAFALVKNQFPETEFVSIYGELFGGTYAHKEVEAVKGSVKVQKGIFYAPHNDFYAFDIRINNEKYLGVEEANAIFEELDFFYAKTLEKGDLETCLAYPNLFNSFIAQWLGLPEIEDNVAEGTIIKPVKPLYLKNGSRVLLKNKNEKWEEKAKRHNRGEKKAIVLSEGLQSLQTEIADYVTVNRLNNVISKIGEVSPKQYGKLIGLLSRDALEDFLKDFAEPYQQLEKQEQKLLNKSLNKLASKLIRIEL